MHAAQTWNQILEELVRTRLIISKLAVRQDRLLLRSPFNLLLLTKTNPLSGATSTGPQSDERDFNEQFITLSNI
ncbi:MAG: hypothetical protein ACP5E9_02005 [Candidatus Methanospirareceae archaeon]